MAGSRRVPRAMTREPRAHFPAPSPRSAAPTGARIRRALTSLELQSTCKRRARARRDDGM
jgi:hypothetical protein